jgi:hypothetical protein
MQQPQKFWVSDLQSLENTMQKWNQHQTRVNPVTGKSQSQFASHTTAVGIWGMVRTATPRYSVQPAGGGGVKRRLTFPTNIFVGYDMVSGYGKTQYLTVIFAPTGSFNDLGMEVYDQTSVFPGC